MPHQTPLPSCSAADASDDTSLVFRLLEDPQLGNICRDFESKALCRTDTQLGFNAFKLVSDTFYKENFHSDVLAAFFDMEGAHGEQSLFLHQFLKLLKLVSPDTTTEVQHGDFVNYQTQREQGRIDIRVLDVGSKKAVVIENKINDAGDMPRQLPRYVEDTQALGYKVVAVVYLSIDGRKPLDKHDWIREETKEADSQLEKEIESRLIKLPAVADGNKPSLLTHWVNPCLQLVSSADAMILLRQYGRLLQYLGAKEMNYTTMKAFHEWLKKDRNHYKQSLVLRQMIAEIPTYMSKMIADKYSHPDARAPFERAWVWDKPGELRAVLDGFTYKQVKLAIDIVPLEKQFSVRVFDRDHSPNEIELVKQALTKAELIEKFQPDQPGRYYKIEFDLPNQEDDLFAFINQQILPKFRDLKKRAAANE